LPEDTMSATATWLPEDLWVLEAAGYREQSSKSLQLLPYR